MTRLQCINTLRPRQNGRHFPDNIFKCIFMNENVYISSKILLKFVPKGPSNNIPALVQIMAWRRPGDKPLSELMTVGVLTHICVTRPQWVNGIFRRLVAWTKSKVLKVYGLLKNWCNKLLHRLKIMIRVYKPPKETDPYHLPGQEFRACRLQPLGWTNNLAIPHTCEILW